MVGSVVALFLVALVLVAVVVQVVGLAGRQEVERCLRRLVTPIRSAVTVLGWLALVVAADVGLGALWNAWQGETRASSREVAATVEGQIPRDSRADSPAYDGYPWAEDYLAELQVQRYRYKPFLVGQLRTSEGRYVNTGPGFRRSYEPAGASGDDAIEVWFFGGSTLFGEGQRDEFTIPSQIARMAEDEGLIIRPVNMGHQGQLSWQEMLRLEMEIARRGPPDLAVFYDGTNDYNYQLADHRGQPTHGDVATVGDDLSGSAGPLPSQLAGPTISIWDRLHEASAVGRLVERLGAISFITPAAAGTPPGPEPLEEQIVEDVTEVYGRSVELARVVGDASGVSTLFFWQPVKKPPGEYLAIADRLPEGVIDITDAYDDISLPIFIDGGHTNELGARVVAEAMYGSIRPQLLAAGRQP